MADTVDTLFKALADPTRRHVLDELSKGPASVTELAAPLTMALPSFVQHLRVLEASGLVTSTKRGRVRTYRIVSKRMQLAESWLARRRRMWERRLDQLDSYLYELKEKDV